MNEETPHKEEQVSRKIVEFKPNVYYFILDGYVRQDIMSAVDRIRMFDHGGADGRADGRADGHWQL